MSLLSRYPLLSGKFGAWTKTNSKLGAFSRLGLDACCSIVFIEDFTTNGQT